MLRASRRFDRCLFDAATIREAVRVFGAMEREPGGLKTGRREIRTKTDTWEFDDDDEFFAAYDTGGFEMAWFAVSGAGLVDEVGVQARDDRRYGFPVHTEVNVGRPTRGEIERVFSIFGERVAGARVPEPQPDPPEPPTVFIGHGRSPLWKDLNDHLRDQQGYEVEAYETGARAGHTIRDILERMMERSSFAVLVMTAEDEQADGGVRARQNVVHEAGLFQGRLGFDKAIVAIEADVIPFSNLDGIHQLRFGAGNIREIFGDVIATLRREFP
jgi:hypothetical protein